MDDNVRRLFVKDEKKAIVELDEMQHFLENVHRKSLKINDRIGDGLPELSGILNMIIVNSRYYGLWCKKVKEMIGDSPHGLSDEQDKPKR